MYLKFALLVLILSLIYLYNFVVFKEMLATPDNSPRSRGRPKQSVEIARLQDDPRARPLLTANLPPPIQQPIKTTNIPNSSSGGGFMTLGPKKRLQRALMKMNILPKNIIGDVCDDSSVSAKSDSSSNFKQSHSHPDLTSISYLDDARVAADYPEHVLKVYKPDQTCKYLLVHKETTAHEVVMLALQEFGSTETSNKFSLCEVSVSEGGIIKQRRLPDQLQNLAERIGLSSRSVLNTDLLFYNYIL